MERLKLSLGFEGLSFVEPVGRSGGVALLWRVESQVRVIESARNFIDAHVRGADGDEWRLTAMYGEPNRGLRARTWELIKTLKQSSNLPWCIIGDLNNVTCQEDKIGGRPYPMWLIEGFNRTLEECNLVDLELLGHAYTWEKGRDSAKFIEVKLDRALASKEWLLKFPDSKLFNLEASPSDHSPILLEPVCFMTRAVKKRFRFENASLREEECFDVVKSCWFQAQGSTFRDKVDQCGVQLQQWGKGLTGNFRRRFRLSRRKVAALRGRRDHEGMARFNQEHKQYMEILTQKEIYWKQRSKQLWLKSGDSNTKYFHAMASHRRCTNSISKLKDEEGNWRDWNNGLPEVMMNYFSDLFTHFETSWLELLEGIQPCVTSDQNQRLMRPITENEVRIAVFQMHPDKAPGPDGMNPGFYQRCWDIVGADLVKLVKEFFATGRLEEGLNETNIVLIAKKAEVQKMVLE